MKFPADAVRPMNEEVRHMSALTEDDAIMIVKRRITFWPPMIEKPPRPTSEVGSDGSMGGVDDSSGDDSFDYRGPSPPPALPTGRVPSPPPPRPTRKVRSFQWARNGRRPAARRSDTASENRTTTATSDGGPGLQILPDLFKTGEKATEELPEVNSGRPGA